MAGRGLSLRRDEGAVTGRLVAGPALYQVSVTPEAPRAFVGILHGYADHAARYSHVMDAWAEAGLASIALDMRGHGRATGARGGCVRFQDFLDDASELARLVAERAQGLPSFLFGHSFGGLVATLDVLASRGAWRGLLLSAPYIGRAMAAPAWKLALGRVASRVAPGLALPTGLTGAHVTHDPAKARDYDADPLVFKTATARWFTETVAAQEEALARAAALSLPLYVVVGSADGVAHVPSGRALFEAAGSADKTWDERPGLFHEVLNEPGWEPIAASMARWMLARC
jgi:alpha-beta hydrolase superfamily lysophospholipase